MTRTKVLYIATAGRSGSTLLEQALGSLPGWCSLGELNWVWSRGIVDNVRCGCGERFHDCRFWQGVLEAGFGGIEPVVAAALDTQWRDHRIAANLPMLASRAARERARAGRHQATDVLATVYRAAAAESDARVVVDSSKIPLRPAFLHGRQDIDIFVLQLVRDPRGVGFSWLRTKVGEDRTSLERSTVTKAAVWWMVTNEIISRTAADAGDNLAVLRYEDLVADPRAALTRIGDLVGEPLDLDRLVQSGELTLSTTHAVSGNPDRFRTGTVPLRPDDGWRTAMPRRKRLVATAITAPLLRRFGYPLCSD